MTKPETLSFDDGNAVVTIVNETQSSLEEIEQARDQLKAMLKAGAGPPQGRFADLALLEVVKDYPARHASTMLAFEAATEAARQALLAQA